MWIYKWHSFCRLFSLMNAWFKPFHVDGTSKIATARMAIETTATRAASCWVTLWSINILRLAPPIYFHFMLAVVTNIGYERSSPPRKPVRTASAMSLSLSKETWASLCSPSAVVSTTYTPDPSFLTHIFRSNKTPFCPIQTKPSSRNMANGATLSDATGKSFAIPSLIKMIRYTDRRSCCWKPPPGGCQFRHISWLWQIT